MTGARHDVLHLLRTGTAADSPYGAHTGAMWHAFRRVTRDRVARGGDPDVMVAAATGTFRSLAAWCRLAEFAA